MKVITKEFGEIVVENDDIINFSRAIYGFEDYTKFVILKDLPEDDIMYLQSLEKPDLHFVLIEPYAIIPNYNPVITQEDIEALNIPKDNVQDLKYVLIAVITEDIESSVVNLKSPIVLNPHNKNAIQAILQSQDYPLRYPLFAKNLDGDSYVGN